MLFYVPPDSSGEEPAELLKRALRGPSARLLRAAHPPRAWVAPRAPAGALLLHSKRADRGVGRRCPRSSLTCTQSAPSQLPPASRPLCSAPGLCHQPGCDVPGLAPAQTPTPAQRTWPAGPRDGRSKCYDVNRSREQSAAGHSSGVVDRGCFRKNPEARGYCTGYEGFVVEAGIVWKTHHCNGWGALFRSKHFNKY